MHHLIVDLHNAHTDGIPGICALFLNGPAVPERRLLNKQHFYVTGLLSPACMCLLFAADLGHAVAQASDTSCNSTTVARFQTKPNLQKNRASLHRVAADIYLTTCVIFSVLHL